MPPIVRLRNRGLRLVYRSHPGKLTALALSVRAGARFDGRHSGLAHLTEHMLFQGTFSLDQLALNRRAAELGGEHNADTGYEDISLTFEVLNEDFDAALALLADQYYRTHIDPVRLGKERRVVLEEIRGRRDDPAERLHRRAWGRLFHGPLARPISGTVSSVRAIRASDVVRFVGRHFNHANTVLSVVGGVPLASVRAAVARHFRHGSSGPPRHAPRIRYGRGGKMRMFDPDSNQAFLTILLPVRPEPRSLLATGLALDLVGSDPDSHLFQELRERLGLSYEVSAHLEWGPDWALAVISASGARTHADRLLQAVMRTCRQAAEQGFAVDEIARARMKLRYRYAVLADARLEQALALAESALWSFPTPDETERIAASLAPAEIDAAWRRAVSGPAVTAMLQ
jgi:predicted Zn-dependent peptidase